MKTKPMIAFSTRSNEIFNTRVFYDNESYFNYIEAAGGIPAVVFAPTLEDARQIANTMDGLLVTGGEDSNPKRYNEENTFSEPIAEDIEQSDLNLYQAFKEAGKPILGICRGIQLIAIAEGASLIQDVKHEGHPEHSQRNANPPVPNNQFFHKDTFLEGSELYDIFGSEYPVNSFHHQALRNIPEGFVCSAMSEDGLIEGIEKDAIVGVQWHPERLIKDEKHFEIAKRFIHACSK